MITKEEFIKFVDLLGKIIFVFFGLSMTTYFTLDLYQKLQVSAQQSAQQTAQKIILPTQNELNKLKPLVKELQNAQPTLQQVLTATQTTTQQHVKAAKDIKGLNARIDQENQDVASLRAQMTTFQTQVYEVNGKMDRILGVLEPAPEKR